MSVVRTAMRVLLPILVLLSMAALFLPTDGAPSPLPDKVIHMIIFGGLAANAFLARFRWPVIAASLAAYAVVSEILQGLMPFGRTADWHDSMADFAGIAIGLGAGYLAHRALAALLR